MKNSQTALLKAIKRAGSQAKLAGILGAHPTQISAWLHNPLIDMPVKYGKKIEKWSKGDISEYNLFPESNKSVISKNKNTTISKLKELINIIETQNAEISVFIFVDGEPRT